MSGLPATLCLTCTVSIPIDFYSQIIWGLFILALESGLGCLDVGVGLLTPPGEDPYSLNIPPDAQLSHVGVRSACFASPPLLPILMWHLLYIFSY